MATYAIGDVQGCYAELAELLAQVAFSERHDQLWFLGDLINRGPESLQVVRLVRSLGSAARLVLGNHDLHFLAIVLGGHSPNRHDTFSDLLDAPEVEEIAQWFREQPLLVADEDLGYAMVHAGIPHLWDLDQARALAAEVETVMRGSRCEVFFQQMYGNKPDCWTDDLLPDSMDRLRVITNYLTRLRLVDARGCMNFSHKGLASDAPQGWSPWFQLRAQRPLGTRLLFGHWAALEGGTGIDDLIALDTGCVWGRELTALCLETRERHAVPARAG